VPPSARRPPVDRRSAPRLDRDHLGLRRATDDVADLRAVDLRSIEVLVAGAGRDRRRPALAEALA